MTRKPNKPGEKDRPKKIKQVPRPKLTPENTLGKRVRILGPSSIHRDEEGTIVGWETVGLDPVIHPKIEMDDCIHGANFVTLTNHKWLYFLDGFTQDDLEESKRILLEKVAIYDAAENVSKDLHSDKDIIEVITAYFGCKADICRYFGKGRPWLDRRIEKSPALKAAFVDSIEDKKDHVENMLMSRINGYTHKEEKVFQYQGNVIRANTLKHYPPDVGGQIAWLNAYAKDRGFGKEVLKTDEGKTFEEIIREAWERKNKEVYPDATPDEEVIKQVINNFDKIPDNEEETKPETDV